MSLSALPCHPAILLEQSTVISHLDSPVSLSTCLPHSDLGALPAVPEASLCCTTVSPAPQNVGHQPGGPRGLQAAKEPSGASEHVANVKGFLYIIHVCAHAHVCVLAHSGTRRSAPSKAILCHSALQCRPPSSSRCLPCLSSLQNALAALRVKAPLSSHVHLFPPPRSCP